MYISIQHNVLNYIFLLKSNKCYGSVKLGSIKKKIDGSSSPLHIHAIKNEFMEVSSLGNIRIRHIMQSLVVISGRISFGQIDPKFGLFW